MLNEKGVSEVIGAILLVSLVILGAMIVAVLFLSQPPPQEIPQVNAIAGNNTTISGVEYIYLLHDGGDPLTPIETVIRIDGGRDPGTIEISTEDGSYEPWTSGEWSVGKTLRITDDQPPQSVSLVYSGGSSQALLLTSTFVETGSGGGGGGPVPPEFWTITASAGSGGSISPSGLVQVPDGGSRSFSISPYECYSIANVVVDGSDLGAIPSYQFTNVQEDHTIHATFAPNTFYIDASVDGGGGTIVPSGLQGPYNCHDNETFSITADPGYFIQDVVVDDDMWQGAVSTYTFDDIVSNHTIVAYFSPESNFIIDENVFIYGNILRFDGSTINGPQATVVINGGLYTSDINGGSSIAATTIYFDGNVNLDGGSASLGSDSNPGNIYVNGDLRLWNGKRDIYGDVYVAGNFDLKDAWVHDTVYVDGDLTLGNTPTLDSNARIYYTGAIAYPNNYNHPEILSKCIHQVSVPGFDMPDEGLPPVRPDDWYTTRGYVSGGSLASNLKIFADSYSPSSSTTAAVNVIIIARNGDITLTNLGWIHVSGVLFAPKGKVTFSGDSFEGVVLTRDGFFVTSGGTDVTFRNFEEFFSSPADYPF